MSVIKNLIVATGLTGLMTVSASATTQGEYEQGIKEINSRYQSVYDATEKEGDDIEKESGTCLFEATFDADWEETQVSFDVPEVTFKNRELSFNTVKTTFRNKVIAKTKVPKTYFEVRNIGFGIKTKVPVVRMEMEEVVAKVPEFKWERTSFVTKIPEFTNERVEWKFHILKIKKLKELDIPCNSEKKRAEALSNKVENASERHQAELQTFTANYLKEQSEELQLNINAASAEFDKGIASMDDAIADVRSNGIDPNGVTIEFEGQKMSMSAARAALVKQKEDALAQMRASHREMVDASNAMSS